MPGVCERLINRICDPPRPTGQTYDLLRNAQKFSALGPDNAFDFENELTGDGLGAAAALKTKLLPA